jgi:hypothetical protein
VQPAGNIPQQIRPHVQSIGVAAVIQGNAPQNNSIRWTTYGNYPNNSTINNNNFGFQEPAPQITSDTNQHIPNQQQQQIGQNIPNQNVSGNQPQQAQQQPVNIFNTSMGMPNFPAISQNVMNDIQSIINHEMSNLNEQPSNLTMGTNPPQYQVETSVIDIADDDINMDDQHIDNIIMQALNQQPVNISNINNNMQVNTANRQSTDPTILTNINNHQNTVPNTQINTSSQQSIVPTPQAGSIFEESKTQENQNSTGNVNT